MNEIVYLDVCCFKRPRWFLATDDRLLKRAQRAGIEGITAEGEDSLAMELRYRF